MVKRKSEKEFEVRGFFKSDKSKSRKSQKVISVSKRGARSQVTRFFKGGFKVTKITKKRTFKKMSKGRRKK